MERRKMIMADPVLREAVQYTATATFPVSPAGLACEAELWLSKDGVTKDATSGLRSFTSTGAPQAVSLPVTMPAGGYEYQVFLDVFANGMFIAAYKATENVIVPSVGPIVIVWE